MNSLPIQSILPLFKSNAQRRAVRRRRRLRLLFFWIAASVVPLWSSIPAKAGIIVYHPSLNGGLAGFNAAAGNPPISIDFDTIALNTDIGGSTIAGVTFNAPAGGAPLIVVDGNATFTPDPGWPNQSTNKLFPTSGQNVLSPGGLTLGPGPNSPIENDDLELVFQQPLSAFGFDHLSQSQDGFSTTTVQVFNQSNLLLFSGTIFVSNLGGSDPSGGADFWGVKTTGADLIGRILVDEYDANNSHPDSNIGFDTFRFALSSNVVPEPTTLAIWSLLGGIGLVVGHRRRKRKAA